jgi:hypothetical protein
MIDDDECGAVGGMNIGRGNQSTRRKPAPMPLCPPQIPHDQTWYRTRAAVAGIRRLTAWAMARPKSQQNLSCVQEQRGAEGQMEGAETVWHGSTLKEVWRPVGSNSPIERKVLYSSPLLC